MTFRSPGRGSGHQCPSSPPAWSGVVSRSRRAALGRDPEEAVGVDRGEDDRAVVEPGARPPARARRAGTGLPSLGRHLPHLAAVREAPIQRPSGDEEGASAALGAGDGLAPPLAQRSRRKELCLRLAPAEDEASRRERRRAGRSFRRASSWPAARSRARGAAAPPARSAASSPVAGERGGDAGDDDRASPPAGTSLAEGVAAARRRPLPAPPRRPAQRPPRARSARRRCRGAGRRGSRSRQRRSSRRTAGGVAGRSAPKSTSVLEHVGEQCR